MVKKQKKSSIYNAKKSNTSNISKTKIWHAPLFHKIVLFAIAFLLYGKTYNYGYGIDDKFITKKTLKTKAKVVIPIHTVVKRILEKYNYELPHCIANTHANGQLKEIAERAKIDTDIEVIKTIGGKFDRKVYKKWELVCTHTGRRSFATNSFLAGVPAISIMMITGHATESVFMKYISIDELANAEHIQSHAFFNAENFTPAA